MNNIAVSIKNVKKTFKLPNEKFDSLKHQVINRFKRGRTKGFTSYEVLKGINLEIKKGEFIGIVGRNGAGKSTLLKIIAEIYTPTSGSVKVNGKLVPFIELGVGFNPNLSGRDNVYLNCAMLGFSREEIDTMYDDIVKFAELEEFMGQKLKNYSSGMKVRLAFSCAIRAGSDILVLDEILAVGDEAFQRKCHRYFTDTRRSGKTVILVTHNMNAVREYCDRAVLIEQGKITKIGDVNEIANEYSKLFVKQTDDTLQEGDESNRWGTGQIKAESISVKADEKEIKIDVKVKSIIDVDNFTVAVRLSLLDDTLVAGMSTKRMMNYQKLPIKTGETKRVTFIVPNNLGKKEISVGTLIVSGDNTTTFDSWDDARRINNPNDESYYPIVYDYKVEIS
ncbi:MAG: ATP-binding cassette domain-containing protein [Candidatus Nomurabacteria bacterium]|jgi:ABC-2 type transport system ATP-binding protein|nr:ATP-binding cassette domain-containing protein [Candidatus Nomurabacteria bacterium]